MMLCTSCTELEEVGQAKDLAALSILEALEEYFLDQ